MTDATTMALQDACARLSGADLSERIGSATAFRQSMSMGLFMGEEFNMLLEYNPHMMTLVAVFHDITVGQLRVRARARDLKAEDITRALFAHRAEIEENNGALAPSFEERALGIARAGGRIAAAFTAGVGMPTEWKGGRAGLLMLGERLDVLLKGD